MKRSLVLLFSFLAAFALAKAALVVPIDQEPAHHLILDNDYVRVFDVTVAPHASTLMHRHDRDYIFVTLGDAQIRNERMNENPAQVVLKDGEARYSKGGFAHVAVNIGETPFRNITIELKNPGNPGCGIGAGACENDDKSGIVQKLFSAEHLNVSLTTLEPGQETPEHTHAYPHLAIAVDELTFENHPKGSASRTLSRKKGEVVWVSDTGITHFLKNVGKERARMITLEFK